jgi:LAO/AO transport system kinase
LSEEISQNHGPEHAERHDVIGITGPPGAGKSTLVDQLIKRFRHDGRRPGVILVDPSSPITGGALLGDRIRMQEHALDPDVFIRSLSTRGKLGGLADGIHGVLGVLSEAGFEPLIIETVGVGQSEVEIASVADTVVLVLHPGWGDEIQTAKAGLLEIADIFFVNKSDQGGAESVVSQLEAMLKLGTTDKPVIAGSALTGAGVDLLIGALAEAPPVPRPAERP